MSKRAYKALTSSFSASSDLDGAGGSIALASFFWSCLIIQALKKGTVLEQESLSFLDVLLSYANIG